MDNLNYSLHYQVFHDNSERDKQEQIAFYTKMFNGLLPLDNKTKILDIGCGMGFFMLAAKSWGYENVYGIDTDIYQIKTAKINGLSVECVQDSAAWLKQHENELDIITGLDVLEHMPKEVALSLCRGIYEALKPNGVFISTVPNANCPYASVYRYSDFTHYTSYTEYSMAFLLENCGFKHSEIYTVETSKTKKIPSLFSNVRFFRKKGKTKTQNLFLKWGGVVIKGFYTAFWRGECVALFGIKRGLHMPLTLNIFTAAVKK